MFRSLILSISYLPLHHSRCPNCPLPLSSSNSRLCSRQTFHLLALVIVSCMCLVSCQYLTSRCAALHFNDYFHRNFKLSLYQRGTLVLRVNHLHFHNAKNKRSSSECKYRCTYRVFRLWNTLCFDMFGLFCLLLSKLHIEE